jgi:hypothetical protein
MKKSFPKILVILLVAIQAMWVSPFLPGNRVEAKSVRPPIPAQQTILKLAPLGAQDMGKLFTVVANLSDAKGTVLSDQHIQFYLDDQYIGQGQTMFGVASLIITKNYSAGQHRLFAIYLGNRQYTTSSDTATIQVNPVTLQIKTVPAVAGMHFKLGDTSFVSGQDGVATLPVNHVGSYSLTVDPSSANTDNTRYELERWSDENYTDQRDINIPTSKVMQVGLDVYYKVGMTFKDLSGDPVDPGRVTSITIKSAQGDYYTFPDGQPRWLLASVISRRSYGLEPTNIQYSLMSVLVDGSSVVNQYQQRFYTHPGEIWPLTLLLYSVHISAQDAIFRNSIGTGVALEFPNGRLETIPFSADKDVTISSLARGNYHVQITGISGISSYTPIALSQDQEVDLMLPTQLDIIVAFATGILFALGILFIGRPWLFLLRSRKATRALEEPVGNQA